MPGTELGKAYVQIVPSARGIKGAIESTLSGPLQQTGKSLGSTLSTNIGTGLQKIGGAMTSYITKPALAAVTALAGYTLFSGWKRMTEIDNAKVKLQAIGNSMKDVEVISKNALASVKGTAFGLDAAMTTSAAAVAAGIKPGKELESYLTAIADAAAVAGVDMSSMGSIFNKVATSGKAHNDVLMQMADAGIPIYQYLADQLGVTADEVFELAKSGEIGLADFQEAVETHIGGAAKEIGSETITGALSNLKAAISRIGANFLGSADDENSIAGKILPMLNRLLENLEPLEEKAKELGEEFAKGFERFADAVSKVPLPVISGIASALVSAGPAVTILGKLIPILAGLPGPALAIAAAVAAVGAAFAVAYTESEDFRTSINNLVKEIGPTLLPILKTLGEFLKTVTEEFLSTAVAVGNSLAPVIKDLTPVFKVLVTLIGVHLKAVLTKTATDIQTAANLVRAGAEIIRVAVQLIKQILTAAMSTIKGFASSIKSTLSFSGLVAKVTSVFNSVKNALIKPFQPAYNTIKGIVSKITGLFPLNIGKIMNIKVPHITVNGGSAPWGIGGKGTAPSFHVYWAAKGAIVDGATLIGAGEKGREAIVPLDPLWKKLDNINGTTFNNTFNINGMEDGEQIGNAICAKLEMEMRSR